MATLELLTAASEGDQATVRELLAAGLDQNCLDQALSCAVAYSHLELAAGLIDQGAQLSWGEYDPVRCAVQNGETAATRFCLARGIDVNLQQGLIICQAAVSMPPDFLAWLLAQGADVNINQGQALVNAVIHQRLGNVRTLLEHGANPRLNNQLARREAQSRMARANQASVDIYRLVNQAARNFLT